MSSHAPHDPNLLSADSDLRPTLSDAGLDPTEAVPIIDQHGERRSVLAAVERALTIKVDGDELVTLMTIGSQPEFLVLGYLRNQGLVRGVQAVASIAVDWERELAEVTTRAGRGVRAPTKAAALPELGSPGPVYREQIYRIVRMVSEHNRVYRDAGSVHGCGLTAHGEMLCFFEDVGRHNATDAISGWMWVNGVHGSGKILYSTGRLTTEIVSKAALMRIGVVISRNGVTRRATEVAQRSGVMLVARARKQGFQVFSCHDSLVIEHLK